MMQLKILGCSGGVGGESRTTSLQIDHDILIDCGTGIGDLESEELLQLRHIFLTHSHLDHIAFLPLLVDSCFESLCENPLVVYALPQTIDALQTHIFNWQIWPDFSLLPDAQNAVLQFKPISPGQSVHLQAREITAIEVSHSIAAAGYRVASSQGKSFAFTGDTAANDNFWQVLNRFDSLDLLLAECAYPNSRRQIAELAGHYFSESLSQDLAKLEHRPQLYISHLTPGLEAETMAELNTLLADIKPQQLRRGQVFTL